MRLQEFRMDFEVRTGPTPTAISVPYFDRTGPLVSDQDCQHRVEAADILDGAFQCLKHLPLLKPIQLLSRNPFERSACFDQQWVCIHLQVDFACMRLEVRN